MLYPHSYQPQMPHKEQSLFQHKLKLSDIMAIWEQNYMDKDDNIELNLVPCDCQTQFSARRQLRLLIEEGSFNLSESQEISYENNYDNELDRFFKNAEKNSSQKQNDFKKMINKNRENMMRRDGLQMSYGEQKRYTQRQKRDDKMSKSPIRRRNTYKEQMTEFKNNENRKVIPVQQSKSFQDLTAQNYQLDQQIQAFVNQIEKLCLPQTPELPISRPLFQQFIAYRQNLMNSVERMFDEANSQKQQIQILKQAYFSLNQKIDQIINEAKNQINLQPREIEGSFSRKKDEQMMLQIDTNIKPSSNFSFNLDDIQQFKSEESKKQEVLFRQSLKGIKQSLANKEIQSLKQSMKQSIKQSIRQNFDLKQNNKIMEDAFEIVQSQIYQGSKLSQKQNKLRSSIKLVEPDNNVAKVSLLRESLIKKDALVVKEHIGGKQDTITVNELKIQYLSDRKAPVRVVRLLSPYK